ncbi:ERCC4 domain-containing protein [Intestinibacter bartlettii]|uniref:ERCC4 domain-containing protein n=1 Tax=Intestinibacter bartlettii TaxID=261299 RepID=UPI0039911716
MKFKILIDRKENDKYIIQQLNKFTKIERKGLLFGDYIAEVNTLTVPVIIKRLSNYEDFFNTLLDPKKDINNNNTFFKGFKRAAENNKDIILLVEDERFYKKLFSDEIRNKVMQLEALYPNLKIVPISKTITAKYIYLTLYYRAKNFNKKKGA